MAVIIASGANKAKKRTTAICIYKPFQLWHTICVMTSARKNLRIVLVVTIVLVVGIISWFVVTTKNSIVSVIDPVIDFNQDEMVIDGVHIVEKSSIDKTIEIKAQKAVIASDESRTSLKNFTLVSTGGSMGPVTMVAADGTLYTGTNDVDAVGHVLLHDAKGNTLLTDSLNWNNADQLISTNDIVRMFGERFIIKGQGMLVDVEKETMLLESDVTAIFYESRVTE